LEGFLYPDTYLVPSSSKPEDFVKQVLKNFGDKIAPFEQDFATNKLSMYQILTIASIVEKEATKQEDRDMIAGVFLKRFEVGMSLGADPTVLYALGSWKADLTVAALNMDSPYNTRKFTGLPPSPICNPSISSIKATLRPTSTDYLYFVAKDGKNYYSKTLEEHEKKKNELGVY
ncbi:MAG: endolytic transglycosylase MltG, partial [bacterium]